MKTRFAVIALVLALTLTAGISEAATNHPEKTNHKTTATVTKKTANKNNKSKKAHAHHHAQKQKKTGNK